MSIFHRNTYKLLLVDVAQVKLSTVTSAVKGLPIGVILVYDLPEPYVKMIDTEITVNPKKP